MTAGGDIVALTTAALQSLNGPGMTFIPQEASSSSHSIFSPLPPKQATNISLAGHGSTTKTQLKSAEFSNEGDHHLDGSPQTLSPVTISARDIEGGSADFTEFCTGGLSFSDGDDIHAVSQVALEKPHYAEIPFTSLGQDRVDSVTPPIETSSPLAPVPVRMSARKLREIQSPHSTVSSSSAGPSNDSSYQTWSKTPRALTQPTKEIRNQKYTGKATVQPAGAWAKKSLQQGVLLDKGGTDPTAQSFSDDSVIINSGPAQSGLDQRRSRMKLLEETSRGKNAAPITQHLSAMPQQIQLVKVSTSPATQEAVPKPEGVAQRDEKPSRNVKQTRESLPAPPPTDIVDTAKLVATCTAAATAALLQASTHTKPPCDEAPDPLPLAAKHDHRPARSPKHSLPAAKPIAQHSITKSTNIPHLVQEMDKYGYKEGGVAHSGKRAKTTTKQSHGQRKLHLCNTLGEEGNKLKPVADKKSTQEQISRCGAPYCDSSRPEDHRNKPLSPGRREGRSGGLQNHHATQNHSAPTLSGEADAAVLNLIDTKNDFTSRRAPKAVSLTSLAQSELRARAQLTDVLNRIQKLEDYQHARNLEAAKASPISAKFHHSSLHSKINKRTQPSESDRQMSPQTRAAVASGHSDRRGGAPPPPRGHSPPRTEERKGMDVLIHAERVLGEVQTSRRHMDIQSELEETERAFDDFIQALGSESEDGCQEGISLKVTEFLSSLPLAGSAAGKPGKHQSHNVALAGGVDKQKSKRSSSKRVVFDDRSTPHQHIPICDSCHHSLPSLPTSSGLTGKSSCLQSHLPCGFEARLEKRMHTSSSLDRAPLQVGTSHVDNVDTRDIVDHSSFPCHPPPQQSSLEKDTSAPNMKLSGIITGKLAAAVPLGAPCIMPSPFYDELDDKSGLVNVSSVMEHRHGSADLETNIEYKVADIGLQTSFPESQGEGSEESSCPKAPQSLSTQGLDEECTSLSEVDEGMDTVSIVGQKASTPPACSQPQPQSIPLSTLCQGSNAGEGKSITSGELDKRLQDHLKMQATEWVGRELLAKMLSQMQYPLDPVSPHSLHDTNSCPTCTSESNMQDNETAALDSLLGPDGIQKFIDAGIPVNKSLVLDLVKDIVKEEVSKLVQEMAGRPHSPSDKMDAHYESGDEFSYTPPESGSVLSSETTTPILSTPQATPPQSPLPDHTPDVSTTNELSLHADVATPTETPPLSLSDEIKETSIATPQTTEEDASITIEPELHSKNGSSICHPESAVCTPSVTATPELVSVGSPPQSQHTSPPLMQDRSQQITPIQHTHEPLSESTTTSNAAHGAMSSSTSTSGREISAGELLTQRPHIALAVGMSFSEGEVAYSPGDAQWYSHYAATMNKAGLTGWKAKPKRKLDPTMETFLDLKNSPDPSSSDSSQLSEDPGKVYSIGEVRKSKRRPQGDPFNKFLSRLEALSPDSSSTPAGPNDNGSDNTLSEMPSIHHDETVTPATIKHVQRQIKVIPYHQKYPLQRNGRSTSVNVLGRLSPGEVPRHIHGVLHQGGDNKRENIWKWSVGEMDTDSNIKRTEDNPSDHSSLRPDSPETNTLRDGIDVINISNHSPLLPKTRHKSEQESSLAAEEDNVLLVQPVSTSSLLQVTEVTPSDEASPVKTQAVKTSGVVKEASSDMVVDLEVSESFHSLNNQKPKNLVGTMVKPLTVTIPTADMNPSLNENPSSRSISEHVDNSYSSDFDFSSISIPGF